MLLTLPMQSGILLIISMSVNLSPCLPTKIHPSNNTQVKGVWYGCKHAVLAFRKYGKTKGSVINTASVVALVGSAAAQLAYTASKGAVLAMTRELAMVHAREGQNLSPVFCSYRY